MTPLLKFWRTKKTSTKIHQKSNDRVFHPKDKDFYYGIY